MEICEIFHVLLVGYVLRWIRKYTIYIIIIQEKYVLVTPVRGDREFPRYIHVDFPVGSIVMEKMRSVCMR